MSQVSRRSFLRTSVAAAGGVTAIGAAAATGGRIVAEAMAPAGVSDGPVVAYVRDAGGDAVSVVHGDGEVVIHDAQLVRRLARAARRS